MDSLLRVRNYLFSLWWNYILGFQNTIALFDRFLFYKVYFYYLDQKIIKLNMYGFRKTRSKNGCNEFKH